MRSVERVRSAARVGPALALAAMACTAEPRLDVVFRFPPDPPSLPAETHVYAWVEAGDPWRIARTLEPQPLTEASGVTLEGVPVGVRIRLAVELRAFEDPDAPVILYGRSPARALDAASPEVVVVELVRPPTLEPGVLLLELDPAVRGPRVGPGLAPLLITVADPSLAVELTRVPGGGGGPCVVRVEPPSGGPCGLSVGTATAAPGLARVRVGWPVSGSGVQRVAARRIDGEGYGSDRVSLRLDVDADPPRPLPAETLVRIAPGPLDPRPDARPRSLAAGSRVDVEVRLDEPAVPGSVRLRLVGPRVLSSSVAEVRGSSVRGAVQVPLNGAVDGAYALVLEAADGLGNAGTSTLAAAVSIDTAPPAPPNLRAATATLERRLAPGAAQADAALRTTGPLVEPGLEVWVVEAGVVLPADDQGALSDARGGAPRRFPLAAGQATVTLQAIDDAGNQSAPVEVRDGVLVLDASGAPLFQAPYPRPGLWQGPDALGDRVAASAGGLAVASPMVAYEPRARPVPRPPAITSDTAVPDLLTGELVVAPFDDLTGGTWRFEAQGRGRCARSRVAPEALDEDRCPSGGARREGRAWATDPVSGVVYAFGGEVAGQVRDDTWALASGTWRRVVTAASPPARRDASLVWDPRAGRLLLFGGLGADGALLGDTWALREGTWTRLTAPGPSPRRYGATAFSVALGGVVLYGGLDGAGALGDLWVHGPDGWRGLGDQDPGPRAGAALAETPEGLVLFGGRAGALLLGDRWKRTAEGWQPLLPPDPEPTPRWRAVAVPAGFVSPEASFVGGLDATGAALFDTVPVAEGDFVLVGRPGVPDGPAPRQGHAEALCRAGTLLVGGATAQGLAADAWLDDRPISPAPEPRLRPAMAAVDDDRVLLHGGLGAAGLLGDTWVFEAGRWSSRGPSAFLPTARTGHAIAADGAGGALLFGGEDPDGLRADTWRWTAAGWTELAPQTAPPARRGHVLGFDPGSGTVVLFGGRDAQGALGDAWTFDGVDWQALVGAQPEPRDEATLVFDATLGGLVLDGGAASDGRLVDSRWLFRGGSWQRLSVGSPAPEPRTAASAVAFGDHHRLFSGRLEGGRLSPLGFEAVSARVVLSASLSLQGLGLEGRPLGPITVRARTGADVGGADSGVLVDAWSDARGEWLLLGRNDASSPGPGPLVATEPALPGGSRVATADRVALRLRSAASARGGRGAAVFLGALELELPYGPAALPPESRPCGPSAPCDAGQWCAPTPTDGLRCVPEGPGRPGEGCDPRRTCGRELVCVARYGLPSTCQALCSAVPERPLPCPAPSATSCEPLPELELGALGYGSCAGRCDVDAGLACVDPAALCLESEVFGTLADLCVTGAITVAPGAPCATAEGTPCGSRAVCAPPALVGAPGIAPVCAELCRWSRSPMSGPHPDCTRGRCADLGGGEVGLCVE